MGEGGLRSVRIARGSRGRWALGKPGLPCKSPESQHFSPKIKLLGDEISHLFGLSLNHVEGWREGRFAHSHFSPSKNQLQGEVRSGGHSNLLVETILATDSFSRLYLNPASKAGKVLLGEVNDFCKFCKLYSGEGRPWGRGGWINLEGE